MVKIMRLRRKHRIVGAQRLGELSCFSTTEGFICPHLSFLPFFKTIALVRNCSIRAKEQREDMKFKTQIPVMIGSAAFCALIVWLLTYTMLQANDMSPLNSFAIVVAGLYALTVAPSYAFAFWVAKNADYNNPNVARWVLNMFVGYSNTSPAVFTLPLLLAPLFFCYYLKVLFAKQ